MQTSPISRVIVIRNKQGLHARPAEEFVRLARTFESKIELIRDGRRSRSHETSWICSRWGQRKVLS